MKGLTLESAEAAFCEWRTTRRSVAEKIPDNLWFMALGLYPQYQRSKICERLRLSGSQFKRRLEGAGPVFADKGFVLASREAIKLNPTLGFEVQLTIQGKERALTLCVGLHALGQILPYISELL
jgi:hypothetical protein